MTWAVGFEQNRMKLESYVMHESFKLHSKDFDHAYHASNMQYPREYVQTKAYHVQYLCQEFVHLVFHRRTLTSENLRCESASCPICSSSHHRLGSRNRGNCQHTELHSWTTPHSRKHEMVCISVCSFQPYTLKTAYWHTSLLMFSERGDDQNYSTSVMRIDRKALLDINHVKNARMAEESSC